MDFSFTDDQEQLRAAVRRLGRDARDAGLDAAAVWRAATEQLGLTSIGVAEERGGAGGGFVDAAVVMEEAGRTLLPAPVTTALVANAVLDRAGVAVAPERVAVVGVATGIAADGDRLTGVVDHVLDGDRAELLVVAAPDALWLVDLASNGVDVRRLATLDETRGQARVHLQGAAAVRIGAATDAGVAVDLLRVALSVEAVGAARHCLETTVDYLKTREQFGRPIGSFQALQHRAADLVVDLEAATSTGYYAAWAAGQSLAGEPPDELPVVAPLAKAVCCDAAWRVAAQTIQMHGGIGFTWEHDAHRYFKRLTSSRLALGDAHMQRRLVAERAAIGRATSAPALGGR